MILYHFTSSIHLPKIMSDGFLKVTESNISERREHAGPDVVWLTSNPDPAGARWQGAGVQNWHPGVILAPKDEIRFTVDVPKRDVHKWLVWSRARGIDPGWAAHLASVGGSRRWHVIERPVVRDEWVTVNDLRMVAA